MAAQKLLDFRQLKLGSQVPTMPCLPIGDATLSHRVVKAQSQNGRSLSDPIREKDERTTLPKIGKSRVQFCSEQSLPLTDSLSVSFVVPKSQGAKPGVKSSKCTEGAIPKSLPGDITQKMDIKSQQSENSDLGDDPAESVESCELPKRSQLAHLPRKLQQIVEWREVIGYGTFGDVYRAYWPDGKKEIAVKIVKLNRDLDLENYKHEIKIWRDLRHTLLVRLYKYYFHTQTATVYMFMELAKHGSLYNFIENTRKQGGSIDLKNIINWAGDILQALSYLHDRNIAHRDLKSPNVVLCDSHVRECFHAKICDFGTSRIIDHTTQATGMIGSTRWMAPEVMRGEKYSCKCDVYSFGILLWEMLTCQVPFHNKTNPYAIMWSVLEFNERPPIPDTGAWCAMRRELVRNIVEPCWESKTVNRPTARELLDKLVEFKD